MLPCWLPPIVRAIASVLLTCLLARVQESTARHEGSPLGSSFVTLSDSSSGESESRPACGVRGAKGWSPSNRTRGAGGLR